MATPIGPQGRTGPFVAPEALRSAPELDACTHTHCHACTLRNTAETHVYTHGDRYTDTCGDYIHIRAADQHA